MFQIRDRRNGLELKILGETHSKVFARRDWDRCGRDNMGEVADKALGELRTTCVVRQ